MFNKISQIWITEKEKIRSQWDDHKKFKLGEGKKRLETKKKLGNKKREETFKLLH